MALHLSVNLNKVALLRNSRGADNPSPRIAAETVIDAGAAGITLHWREDNRHTRVDDVRALCALCRARGVEFNLEGDARDELIELALQITPTQLTLVPVTPGEVTSDHGWDLPRDTPTIAPILGRVAEVGIRTAIFVDAEAETMTLAAETGTQRVEIYTEPYAAAFGTTRQEAELGRVRECARAASRAGLGVNAGHDLDLRNLPPLATEVPELLEVSIGHALVADALYMGLDAATRAYLRACRGQTVANIPVTS